MDEEFLIWSVKLSSWWGQQSTYTTDIKGAKRFTREKAIAFCRARHNGQMDNGLTCIPVSAKVIEEIVAK